MNGILGETGIWPYKYVIKYKKLMFLHHLVHSGEDRIAKQIVLRQEQMIKEQNNRRTWYYELKEWIQITNIDIDISTNKLEEKSKSVWKKELKVKLLGAIEKEFQDETQKKTKLRFQRGKPFQKEEYVKNCNAELVERIMKIRLNIVECKSNFKGKYSDTTCLVCNREETTEHLFECEHYRHILAHTGSWRRWTLHRHNGLSKLLRKWTLFKN